MVHCIFRNRLDSDTQTLTNKHFLLPLTHKFLTNVIHSCNECCNLSTERPFSLFLCVTMSRVGVPRLLPFLHHLQTLIMCYFRCWLLRPEAFEGVRLSNEALWRREVMWRDGAAAESLFVRWQPLIRHILKPPRGLCSCCISNSLLSSLLSVVGTCLWRFISNRTKRRRKIGRPKRTRLVCCVLTLFQRCDMVCHFTVDHTGTK